MMRHKNIVFAKTVRGRLAPSPTGHLHLGNAWTFLLAWLAVRVQGGRIVLRMEDIDPQRSRPEYVQAILRDLAWLGLDWDEGPDRGGAYGPYTQQERLDRYAEVIDLLTAQGQTYPCYCTRKELACMASAPHAEDVGPIYPGVCRGLSPAECLRREAAGGASSLRLRGGEALEFADLVHGPVRLSWAACGGDFPLRRSDGVISYQLAVAVDDMDQGIDLVVRGEDILPCTPRQVLLFQMLNGVVPSYAHVPLVLDHKGERLAKRHRSYELRALREAGVDARVVVGFLAWQAGLLSEMMLVWPQELTFAFDWRKIPRHAVILEEHVGEKLKALSKEALGKSV